MFLGGNEGFAARRRQLLRAGWSRQYAIKVAGMMRVYLQDGAASVYWFLIPTPSSRSSCALVNAVNAGIERAAARFPQASTCSICGRCSLPAGATSTA